MNIKAIVGGNKRGYFVSIVNLYLAHLEGEYYGLGSMLDRYMGRSENWLMISVTSLIVSNIIAPFNSLPILIIDIIIP